MRITVRRLRALAAYLYNKRGITRRSYRHALAALCAAMRRMAIISPRATLALARISRAAEGRKALRLERVTNAESKYQE